MSQDLGSVADDIWGNLLKDTGDGAKRILFADNMPDYAVVATGSNYGRSWRPVERGADGSFLFRGHTIDPSEVEIICSSEDREVAKMIEKRGDSPIKLFPVANSDTAYSIIKNAENLDIAIISVELPELNCRPAKRELTRMGIELEPASLALLKYIVRLNSDDPERYGILPIILEHPWRHPEWLFEFKRYAKERKQEYDRTHRSPNTVNFGDILAYSIASYNSLPKYPPRTHQEKMSA